MAGRITAGKKTADTGPAQGRINAPATVARKTAPAADKYGFRILTGEASSEPFLRKKSSTCRFLVGEGDKT
jgi:hypothetical protein